MPDGYTPSFSAVRAMPANVQAEQALLGTLLINNRALEHCGGLEPAHFADPDHRMVFAAIRDGVGAGRVVDMLSLKDRFEPALLGNLAAAFIGHGATREYAQVIVERAQHRELLAVAEDLAAGCYAARSPAEIAAEVVARIDRATQGQQVDRLTTLDAAMDAALADMERAKDGALPGISTGFPTLDARLGGLEPGYVYVIAGRPGMGKSALAHGICINAARAGAAVLEVSLEMPAKQLGGRALAAAAGLPIAALKRAPTVGVANRIVAARRELAGLPLVIDDAAGQTPRQIAAKARAARRQHGLGLIMIDHLNLMRPDDEDARHGGTWAVSRASNTVLQLAKQAECPVILCVQLNRGPESREDKRPNLADLRQSGEIEQDAYAVGFVYRPEYYLGNEPERREADTDDKFNRRVDDWRLARERVAGRAEVIWQKVRDGETGTDVLAWDGPTASFSEAG